MQTINQILIEQCCDGDVKEWMLDGIYAYRNRRDLYLRKKKQYNDAVIADVRALHGFKRTVGDVLTAPDANMKLGKTARPTYGLTLQHYVTKLVSGLTVNGCEWAGHCTKVCVLDNGSGRYDSVQQARRWRTYLLVHHAREFFFRMGYELARAVAKHGEINFRPNVNSDVSWELWLRALFNGELFGECVWSYGYTKNPAVLYGDGWLFPYYRVAYSKNERTHAEHLGAQVHQFLERGGAVAVVTNRRPGDPVQQWGESVHPIVDADVADDWMFESGVIGDLSAKGKARKLIGKSAFVARISEYVKPVLVSV